MSDNPLVEPAEQFYNTTESEEPNTPTEEAVVKVAEIQDPPQEEEKLENPSEDETKLEESESEDEEKETQYLDLDGEETSLDDVRMWKNGHMMQKDYTQKTQAHAKEREDFETERTIERENLLKEKSDVSEMRDQLTVLVAEDEEIDWVELKEDDPEQYIELKEKADKRKAALEKVKAERETPKDDPALIQTEREKLFAANPDWFDDGKPTEAYTADIGMMNDYVAKAGYSAEEFKNMTRSHQLTTILKAAKYDELQEKGRKIKETREKVPVVTKPKATNTQTQSTPIAEVFYGKG